MIQHNKPCFDQDDIIAVTSALQSGYVAQGREVESFESELSSFVGCKYSTLVNSGTTAIYLALYALNVGKGDEVILPTYVCSALLNAIFMRGANPCIVDVNDEDFNVNWDRVAASINANTKAIIVPHIHGMPSYVPGARFMGVPIIEDCATAIGSYVHLDNSLTHVGGGISDISIFSFYATKFCAMGYGGFVVTNNKDLAEKAQNYREFDCVEDYEPRFNFQVSDLNAALGRSQLKKVGSFLHRRKLIRDFYDECFDAKGIKRQQPLIPCQYNNYRYIIRLDSEKRDRLEEHLQHEGIKTIIPIEQFELLHNYLKLPKDAYSSAENIASTTLSLPMYPALTDGELQHILTAIKSF